MWRTIVLLAALVCAAAPPAHATQPAEQPYRIDSGSRFLTAVMIDGKGPFSFVIDTASSRTLIYEHVRAALGLAQSQPGSLTVYGINSTANALPVKPGVLTVAGQQVSGLTLGVLPYSGREPAGVDGILGIDVLARYFVVLDRSAMRLILLPPDSEAAGSYRDWPDTPLTPRRLKNIPINFWYLPAQFGRTRLTTLFDLGAGMTMMNWFAAERLGVHERDFKLPADVAAAVRDVLGTDEPVVKVSGLDIALDRRHWDNQTVLVADSDVFTHFNLDESPAAIVGASLFRDNSLAIDFANHRLHIGPQVKWEASRS
ncbi:MAG: clan AA aspartic protease [Alphaproteobacteria bacterium]|nr:clan AA aspartic protease [Alphaproteobacteria bacterium]